MLFCLLLFLEFTTPIEKIAVYRNQTDVYCDMTTGNLIDSTSTKHLISGVPLLIEIKFRLEAETGHSSFNSVDTIRLGYDIWNDTYEWKHGSEEMHFKDLEEIRQKVRRFTSTIVALDRLEPTTTYHLRASIQLFHLRDTSQLTGQSNPLGFLKSSLHFFVRLFFGWLSSGEKPLWHSSDSFTLASLSFK